MPTRAPVFRSKAMVERAIKAAQSYVPQPTRPHANNATSNQNYDADWRRLRRAHLMRHPLCLHCEAAGRIVEASDVDHRIPISVAPWRRLDSTNLQSLCHSCHSKKTMQDMREQPPKPPRRRQFGDLSAPRTPSSSIE